MKLCKNTRSGLLVLGLLLGNCVSAGVILNVNPGSGGPGTFGNTFDVTLTNTGPSAISIAGFNFTISVANPAIVFTGGTTGTAAPYIFSGHSLFGPDLTGAVSAQTIALSDLFDTPFAGALLAANSSAGLGRISFDIANGAAAGVFRVVFAVFPGTSLSDPDNNDIAIGSLTSGAITITGTATATPEPGGASMILLFAIVGLAACRTGGKRLRLRKPFFVSLAMVASSIAVLADSNGTLTLLANTRLDLDAGAVTATAGDLLWTGTSLNPQGRATAYVLRQSSGQQLFDIYTDANLAIFKRLASAAAIPASSLPADSLLAVYTNGAIVAKVLVTANAGGSLALRYQTYGTPLAPDMPLIETVTDAAARAAGIAGTAARAGAPAGAGLAAVAGFAFALSRTIRGLGSRLGKRGARPVYQSGIITFGSG